MTEIFSVDDSIMEVASQRRNLQKFKVGKINVPKLRIRKNFSKELKEHSWRMWQEDGRFC